MKLTLRQNTPTKPPYRGKGTYIVSGDIKERLRFDPEGGKLIGTGQMYAVNHEPFSYGRDRCEARQEARLARRAELRKTA